MLLEVDHHSGVPIYRQVIEQIRRQILSGGLEVGEQLVSVRQLAGQLKVNPMTISKAYGQLEMEGLLERRRGVGLFVARVRESKKDRNKLAMLEDSLRKSAMMAGQLGISREKALKLFEKLCKESIDKKRR